MKVINILAGFLPFLLPLSLPPICSFQCQSFLVGQNKVGVHAVAEDGESHSGSEGLPEPSIMRTSTSGHVALYGESAQEDQEGPCMDGWPE